MTIDALGILAFMALLARSLARHNPQRRQLGGREIEVVMMWTLVGLTGIEVAAPHANVVLVAGLHLLDAQNFVAIVLHRRVHALALLVTVNASQSTASWGYDHILELAMSILPCDGGPCPAASVR